MEDIREEEIRKHEEAEISKRKDNREVEKCLEESLLHFKKLNAISVSSEVDDCTKMIDEIQDLLKKIESLKNLKPPSDIEYVKNDILLHKSRIRNLIKDLDSSLAFGKLPSDSKGEIDFINAFCYKCLSKNITTDSIFILCDGGCKRGFHQSCFDPYLSLEPSTPYSNALGWICYECHWKALCFDLLQKYHKTRLLTADSWEKVFPEAEEYRPPSSDSKDSH